jgi:STE24 endopeptidase
MSRTTRTPCARRYGLWRALAAAPAMLGGLAVVVLLAGGLGRWTPVVPLAWLVLGPLWLTAAGERIAVRVAFGYRHPVDQARTALAAAIEAARARCGGDLPAFELYVRPRATALNAHAAGRRSVAVTAGLVNALARGTLSPAEGGALLTHEIGHLRARDTRYGLAVAWLTAPWRAVVAVFGGLVRLIVGKVPTARAAVLVLWPLVLAVTAVQAVQQHAWVPLAVLAAVGVVLAVQPLVDAALVRAGERAADDYAIGLGAGPELAAALSRMSPAPAPAPAEAGRLRGTHPARAALIAHLAAAATAIR